MILVIYCLLLTVVAYIITLSHFTWHGLKHIHTHTHTKTVKQVVSRNKYPELSRENYK